MHYSNALLDRLRHRTDPDVDAIIETMVEEGTVAQVNTLLQSLIKNSQPIPAELPDTIEFWLRDHQRLPAWVDQERLDRASAFFAEHSLAITLLLWTSGLVGCYAAAKGAKVLTFTYRLEQGPYHRIAETGQFMLAALAPGGLAENGTGMMATLKVRLMHAAIRTLIRQSGRWDTEELGEPINQEDLLGTLMVFSYGTIWGLGRLGVDYHEEDAEDYLYMWRVIGEIMGVDPDYIPTTLVEAGRLSDMIAVRHHGASPEGVLLTRALLDLHNDNIPGEFFDGVIPALIRHIAGDEIADWMEVPRSSWEIMVRHTRQAGSVIDTMEKAGYFVSDMVDQVSLALLHRESIKVAGYEHGRFLIPETLEQKWQQRATQKEEQRQRR